MSRASEFLASIKEGIGDPEEGWCVVTVFNDVHFGPVLQKSDAEKWITKHGNSKFLLKFGKKNSEGEYLATRAVNPSEGYHEPTEDELAQFKKAAAKMIQHIKSKSPNWTDSDGSVEAAFSDNMGKLTRGEFR